MSSDDENFDFDDDFIENIPNDSDSNENDSYSSNKNNDTSPLKLEVGISFFT